jgi:hypothetical protein
MADEENGPDDDDLDEELTRTQAAAFLKVDPRTIVRWQKAGVLKQTPNRKFLKSDLIELKTRSKTDPSLTDDDEDGVNYYQEMSAGLALANQHNERLFALIDKPLKLVLDTLTTANKQLQDQVSNLGGAYIEAMKLQGEALLNKEEREAMGNREAVKTALMANAGENLMQLLPLLVSQVMGKKPEVKVNPQPSTTSQEASALSRFVGSLDKSDLQRLMLLKNAFGGDKRELFEAAMKELGIEETSNAQA